MTNKKLKIGLFSLTGCEGCYFSLLDNAIGFLRLAEDVEIKRFRLFEESEIAVDEFFEIAFVEGSPLTSSNIDFLRELRVQCAYLVALGSCAEMGGIYHLKNYQDKDKALNYVYGQNSDLENFDVLSLKELVKIDYAIPGCPINAQNFIDFVRQIIVGNPKKVWPNEPVCFECISKNYECRLQKGEICLGPITQGGCEAICLKSKQGCYGCRGLVASAEVDNLLKVLKKNHSDQEIAEKLEIFGIKKQINSNKYEND